MATCPTCREAFTAATFCPRDGSRLVDETMDGSVVLDNRYRLIRQVGAGGMGEVYEAEHVHIHRKVAVKILKPEIATDPQAIARLKQEAQTTSNLRHPNIVNTLDFGTAEGQSYLVMEWLDGESLERRLARGPVDISTALDITAQAAGGLGEAHAGGVIHRDVKPANLLLTLDRNGAMVVKVVDFGIAKLAASRSSLTATGVLIGTPIYMAPEQAMGEPSDERTDIYALGVILYEMLTGVPPFRAETPLAVLHQHTTRRPVPPTESTADRAISPEVELVVMRCLEKQPSDRFGSMTELVHALDEVRGLAGAAPSRRPIVSPSEHDGAGSDDDEPRRPKRTGMLIAIACVVLVGAAATVFVTMRTKTPAAGALSGGPHVAGVDATTSTDAAVSDASIAGIEAARPVDAPIVVWRHEGRGRNFAFVATSSERPVVGQSFTMNVVLSELSKELLAEPVRVRLVLEYFRDHAVAHNEVREPSEGSVWWTMTIGHAGKHHARLELLHGARRVDIARFDLAFATP